MSSSSFCEEHVYSDCAKFCNWTKKWSVFAFTGVKSNGMLSAPSTRSLLVRGWRSRRVCARAPGRLFASTGALMWMKSSSRQKRTVDRPVELFITPRFHSVVSLNKKNSGLVQRSFKKRWKPLEKYPYWKGSRRSAGYASPWSTFSEEEQLKSKHTCEPTSFLHQGDIHKTTLKSRLRKKAGSWGFLGRNGLLSGIPLASTPPSSQQCF